MTMKGLARALIGLAVLVAAASQAQAQQYYYYPTTAAGTGQPQYYYTQPSTQNAGYAGPGYYQIAPTLQPAQYYYAPQTYQTPQYYETTQPAQIAATPDGTPLVQTGYTTPVETAPAQPAAVSSGGDPYGFMSWLNSVRASYGLGAVNYDANLTNWAAMNNNQQQAHGLGHFVMGPARRQNSAMGGAFPGAMWMASPAHRAALLDPTISWFGIAAAGAYWTFNAY